MPYAQVSCDTMARSTCAQCKKSCPATASLLGNCCYHPCSQEAATSSMSTMRLTLDVTARVQVHPPAGGFPAQYFAVHGRDPAAVQRHRPLPHAARGQLPGVLPAEGRRRVAGAGAHRDAHHGRPGLRHACVASPQQAGMLLEAPLGFHELHAPTGRPSQLQACILTT